MSRRRTESTAGEVGRWYDEHSATEVESEEVKLEVKRRYDPTITMRLPETALHRLKALADERGVPTSTMGRMLLLEALDRAMNPSSDAVRVLVALAGNPDLRKVLQALVAAKGEKEIEQVRDLLQEVAGGVSGATCNHFEFVTQELPIPHATEWATLRVIQ
jgi:hypothetical protein